MEQDKKRDNHLMNILKVNTLIRPIVKTNMGELSIVTRKDEEEYFFTLDSVRVSKNTGDELSRLYNIKDNGE